MALIFIIVVGFFGLTITSALLGIQIEIHEFTEAIKNGHK